VELTEREPLQELERITILNSHSLWKPSDRATKFKCLLDPDGIEIFQAENYPSMRLMSENGCTYLVGTYEPNEVHFMVRYLSRFGKSLKIVEPAELKRHMKDYYLDLINRL